VTAEVALNFSVMSDKCADIYQEVGIGYRATIIAPVIQQAIKAVMASFTAEELISKREDVRREIAKLIEEQLMPTGLKVHQVALVDIDFSKSFNEAIEAKVTAEQNALAAKNKLEQVKFEADQSVALAKGKAEAMSIEAKSLSTSPQILQLRALEKWNGILPQVVGSSAIPFIETKLDK
jgi:regulator of protease activity HflC (stomatin/prohibitin superfamily)